MNTTTNNTTANTCNTTVNFCAWEASKPESETWETYTRRHRQLDAGVCLPNTTQVQFGGYVSGIGVAACSRKALFRVKTQKNWTSERWEVARGDDADSILSHRFPYGGRKATPRTVKKALRHLYPGQQFDIPAIVRWLNL